MESVRCLASVASFRLNTLSAHVGLVPEFDLEKTCEAKPTSVTMVDKVYRVTSRKLLVQFFRISLTVEDNTIRLVATKAH